MIQAIGDNIIVKAMREEKKTKILTLDNDKPDYYEVISVGDDVKHILKGDHVLSMYIPTKILYHEDLYVIQEARIYGKKIIN